MAVVQCIDFSVSFIQSTYRVGENTGPVQPVLVLSNPFSTDITVQVRDADYNSGPYNVTFTAGQTSVPFDVPINDDNILENTEMFTLTIDSSTLPDRVTVGDPDQTTVDILDSDSELIVK